MTQMPLAMELILFLSLFTPLLTYYTSNKQLKNSEHLMDLADALKSIVEGGCLQADVSKSMADTLYFSDLVDEVNVFTRRIRLYNGVLFWLILAGVACYVGGVKKLGKK